MLRPGSGALGCLEDGVVLRVALFQLPLDLAIKVVLLVLGFPVAVGEMESVEQCSVYANVGTAALNVEFWYQRELQFATARREQVLKGAADRHLMIEMKLAELVEGGVVRLNGGMGRLEVKLHRTGAKGQVYNGYGCKSDLMRGCSDFGTSCIAESSASAWKSVAPPGLAHFDHGYPGLTPWAAFFGPTSRAR
ncbi:MAG TPA: hypothetical protein VMT53_20200 [Terriglobales bacterium]|nr:hypothetical protein [Terriglobales bacterium]